MQGGAQGQEGHSEGLQSPPTLPTPCPAPLPFLPVQQWSNWDGVSAPPHTHTHRACFPMAQPLACNRDPHHFQRPSSRQKRSCTGCEHPLAVPRVSRWGEHVAEWPHPWAVLQRVASGRQARWAPRVPAAGPGVTCPLLGYRHPKINPSKPHQKRGTLDEPDTSHRGPVAAASGSPVTAGIGHTGTRCPSVGDPQGHPACPASPPPALGPSLEAQGSILLPGEGKAPQPPGCPGNSLNSWSLPNTGCPPQG